MIVSDKNNFFLLAPMQALKLGCGSYNIAGSNIKIYYYYYLNFIVRTDRRSPTGSDAKCFQLSHLYQICLNFYTILTHIPLVLIRVYLASY